MTRILCMAGIMNTGGAETMLMKLYREVNRKQVQFDFLVFSSKQGFYDEEITALGGNIYCLGEISLLKHPFLRLQGIYDFFRTHKYYHVLISTEQAHIAIFALMAKLAGVKNIAIRSTNSSACRGKWFDRLERCLKFIPCLSSDVRFAPSILAANFLFGKNKNVHILHNGIKISDFSFQSTIRNMTRESFNVKDRILFGHIGRFTYQKNHIFLLKVYSEIIRLNPKVSFLLIGVGELFDEIKMQAADMGIVDNIIFAGIRQDVSNCFMAMDGMIFPSLFEGMPNVVIEAQATGLPCLIADTITKECQITDIVEFMSLQDEPVRWALKALEMTNKQSNREEYADKMKNAGYDISDVACEFLKNMNI